MCAFSKQNNMASTLILSSQSNFSKRQITYKALSGVWRLYAKIGSKALTSIKDLSLSLSLSLSLFYPHFVMEWLGVFIIKEEIRTLWKKNIPPGSSRDLQQQLQTKHII
jgi:hypothetical protein